MRPREYTRDRSERMPKQGRSEGKDRLASRGPVQGAPNRLAHHPPEVPPDGRVCSCAAGVIGPLDVNKSRYRLESSRKKRAQSLGPGGV